MYEIPDNKAVKAGAQAWARRALEVGTGLILDTETTGINTNAEIVQIAVIDFAGKVLLDTLIKPKKRIPFEASRIHGIKDEMVAAAITFPELYPHLRTLLHGKSWVIYNADYDTRMIAQDCVNCGLEVIKPGDVSCAMLHYAGYHGAWNDYRESWAWQKLGVAAKHHNIEVTAPEHSALGDCLRTLELIKVMAHEQAS